MKKIWSGIALATACALAVGSYAVASDERAGERKRNLSARLSGFQEVPPISTTGTGRFRLQIDANAEEMRYTLAWSRLENPAQQAHIHFGQRFVNGGISVFLCSNLTEPAPPAGTQPCPTTPEGQIEGVIRPSNVIGPAGQGIEPGAFRELVRAIAVGHTYVNVHTTRFPGGEIRGQIERGKKAKKGKP